MMELKTCKTCGKEKEISEFRTNGYKKNGELKYRPVCKQCMSITGIVKEPRERKEVKEAKKPDNTMGLTHEELNEIKQLLIDRKEFTDMKINIEDKSDRIRKTFNISEALMKHIDKYHRKHNLNYSDVVNIALSKFFISCDKS